MALGGIGNSGNLPDVDSNPIKIRTPHAALLIWNYDNRVASIETGLLGGTGPLLVSTASCVAIKTNKSKGDPQGTFQVVLAPNKNWISLITPGSWCVILMSNQPITELDTKTVDAAKLKMFGKIDTVRINTNMSDDGTRVTTYNLTGVDWGHIFHSSVYIDNNLAAKGEPGTLGAAASLAINKMLFGKSGVPLRHTTTENLKAIIGIFGQEIIGFSGPALTAGLLANAIYNFAIPSDIVKYLRLLDSRGFPSISTNLNSMIQLKVGAMQSGEDSYKDTEPAHGILNAFALQGTHTFWQILQENACTPINELLTDMRPGAIGTSLILYNRVKPFAIRGTTATVALNLIPGGKKLFSYFQNIKTHKLDPYTISAINAGTNWQDKYNFIEIKPAFADLKLLDATYKLQSQTFDIAAFTREGFRPMIVSTTYLPGLFESGTGLLSTKWQELKGRVSAMRLWYFDTHKMLNGTVVMSGTDGYIGVGDNIKFDAKLINQSHNFNLTQSSTPLPSYLLAHVESVSHTFSVNTDGARSFSTTIQFTRGIIVNENGDSLSLDVGAGAVDLINKNAYTDTTSNENALIFPSSDNINGGN